MSFTKRIFRSQLLIIGIIIIPIIYVALNSKSDRYDVFNSKIDSYIQEDKMGLDKLILFSSEVEESGDPSLLKKIYVKPTKVPVKMGPDWIL